ncbi:MAG: hypothetical protein U9Q83_12370 [Bacteroidota bacterium]|nr:hypothetical protein [Bacteroidota bacterium]
MKKLLYFSLIILFFTTSACNVSLNYLKRGQYNMAVRAASKKLQRNKNKKKQLRVLEEAYPKALQKENDRIKYLHLEGKADRWDEIFHIYQNMKNRQIIVEQLYPLYLDSREIRFAHVDYDYEILQAKNKAADYYYVHAKKLMSENDKFAYRQAYNELLKAKNYNDAYKDLYDLLDEAYNKGLSHVILIAVNSSRFTLPNDFLINLINFPTKDFDSPWIKYYTTDQRNGNYDVYANITVTSVTVSPNNRSTRNYSETKKVKDGWEYKLDANGNKVTDSLGNAIKVTKYKTISCTIYETRQYKQAHIEGAINYVDNQTRQIISSVPIAADNTFENYYSTAKGNFDALSNETRAKLKQKSLRYPSNTSMIIDANQTMKDLIYRALMDQKSLLIQRY